MIKWINRETNIVIFKGFASSDLQHALYGDDVEFSRFGELDQKDLKCIKNIVISIDAKHCVHCGKKGVDDHQVYANCKSRVYCSKKCQKRDWKFGHRLICKKGTDMRVSGLTQADMLDLNIFLDFA